MQMIMKKEDEKNKSMVIQKVSKLLSSGNLQVNDTKTEMINMKRSNNDTEEWWKIKTYFYSKKS